MSFKIEKPGEFKQRDGRTSELLAQRGGYWFGINPSGFPCRWHIDGTHEEHTLSDIVGPIPPKPPPGFQTYLSDKVSQWDMIFSQWDMIYRGRSAAQLDVQFPNNAPHYIASPIPKTFRISDHGPGVYECRDGRQATVTGKIANPACGGKYPWEGIGRDGECFFTDEGKFWAHEEESEADLVRYIGPPTEQPWTNTKTPRYRMVGSILIGPINTAIWIEERKWTRGTESEWRPVEVQP